MKQKRDDQSKNVSRDFCFPIKKLTLYFLHLVSKQNISLSNVAAVNKS